MISNIKNDKPLPELLAPAGSFSALEAAIEGGADAVYFGGSAFNARMNAENFSSDRLVDAVALAHAHGVKLYMTLNTLVGDRELPDLLRAAAEAYSAGVDGLIMADLGAISAVRAALPDMPIHASTQASGHSTEAADRLSDLGISRMVCAREMSLEDIRSFTKNSPIEAEVFVHGALCVCHSGQCLFSSLVGGRSGNRGECAQPCRLPFSSKGKKESYPLSLKDLSLARHVTELIDAGVASLKIEGRMKSPEYVLNVTRVWRRLLDERRNATDTEMDFLASVFSRGGFTDGYFTGKISPAMLGIRSSDDKQSSRELTPFRSITKKLPLDLTLTVRAGEPMSLSAASGDRQATVTGEIPEEAQKLPLDRDFALRNLSKLGSTPYFAQNITTYIDDGLAVSAAKLNDLRRRAVEALDDPRRTLPESFDKTLSALSARKKTASAGKKSLLTARFASPEQIPSSAQSYFDRIYLPLDKYDGSTSAVILPAVIFDSERDEVAKMLQKAAELGAKYALVGNLAHLSLVTDAGLIPDGDLRLNTFNSKAAELLEATHLDSLILSPELTLPQLRDIARGVNIPAGAVVYGRIPLMVLEKCAVKSVCGCEACSSGRASLVDRRGISFPVAREWRHRNIIYNSLPTYMADRADKLDSADISLRHFIFTTESKKEAEQIIEAYKKNLPPRGEVRRIQ